jgi:hypothetical protein
LFYHFVAFQLQLLISCSVLFEKLIGPEEDGGLFSDKKALCGKLGLDYKECLACFNFFELSTKYPFVLKCGVAWSLFVKWTRWLDHYLDANPDEAARLGGEASLNDFGADLEARLRKSKFYRNAAPSLRQSADDSDAEMSMEMSRASISGRPDTNSS